MAEEPDDLVLRQLREIRTILDDHSTRLEALSRIESALSELTTLVRYTLGHAEETRFRQSQQGTRIDELFRKLEELLSPPQPV
jgi:hypothetical protein